MKTHILFLLLISSSLTLKAQLYAPNGAIQGSSGNENVGIGIASPGASLHIKSATHPYIRLDKPTIDFEAGLVFGVNGSSDFYFWTDNSNNSLKIEATGLDGEHDMAPRVEFPKSNKNIHFGLSGGNVGIGVTNPRERMHVNGNMVLDCNSHPYIYTGTGAAELNRYLYLLNSPDYRSASGLKVGGILISDSYDYGDPGKNDLIVKGNILIGKRTQINGQYKLDVAGKIRADEIVVNTTGADFVFEPTYKLRTLSELETFIRTNKHLPDIAPAKEMQEHGVSAGEMQAKLLQKVEELTLYVIEKDKEIAVLKVEKMKQNAVNEELRLLLFEMSTRLEKLEKNSNK